MESTHLKSLALLACLLLAGQSCGSNRNSSGQDEEGELVECKPSTEDSNDLILETATEDYLGYWKSGSYELIITQAYYKDMDSRNSYQDYIMDCPRDVWEISRLRVNDNSALSVIGTPDREGGANAFAMWDADNHVLYDIRETEISDCHASLSMGGSKDMKVDLSSLPRFERCQWDEIEYIGGIPKEFSGLYGLWSSDILPEDIRTSLLVDGDGVRYLGYERVPDNISISRLDVVRPIECMIENNKTRSIHTLIFKESPQKEKRIRISGNDGLVGYSKVSGSPVDEAIYSVREEERRTHPALGSWYKDNMTVTISKDLVSIHSKYAGDKEFEYVLDDEGRICYNDEFITLEDGKLHVYWINYATGEPEETDVLSNYMDYEKEKEAQRRMKELEMENARRRLCDALSDRSFSYAVFNRDAGIREKHKLSFSHGGMGVSGYYVAPYHGQYTSYRRYGSLMPFTWSVCGYKITVTDEAGYSSSFTYSRGSLIDSDGKVYHMDY